MKKIRTLWLTLSLVAFLSASSAQNSGDTVSMNLNQCIQYALQHNIQIKKASLGTRESENSYKLAVASRWPDLDAQVSGSFYNGKSLNDMSDKYENLNYGSGNYSIESGVTLYNGNLINNTIRQQDLAMQSSVLSVVEAENNVEIAVTQAYLQILYANESVKQAGQTLLASETQLEWAKNHYDAGAISETDYARIKSQYSSDKYSLIVAQNNLDQELLQLKQILEMDIDDDFRVDYTEIDESGIYSAIPAKNQVYQTSLNVMPEVGNSELNISIAELEYKKTKAGFLPVISLQAGLGSAYNSTTDEVLFPQLDHSFYQNLGLKVSIPIFSGRQNKSALEQTLISIEEAKLSLDETRKSLLKSVESVYLDAVASVSRFDAAVEQLDAAGISYALVEEQFHLGLKTTVDLITEKNSFLAAQQEYLQAKYSAVLNYKLLDFYQGKSIEL